MSEINMDKVAEILRTKHGIANAHVTQTGGNVAVVFAGPTYDRGDGEMCFVAAGGPGSYSWNAEQPSVGDTLDFYVGPEGWEDPDPTLTMADYGVTNEEQIADLMAILVKRTEGNPSPLTFDEIESVGLDATGRAIPPAEEIIRNAGDIYCAANNAVVKAASERGINSGVYIPIAEAAGRAAYTAYRRIIDRPKEG